MSQKNLRLLARDLAEEVNENLLRLGNVLVAIADARLHHAWGYKTWAEYVAEEIGMSQTAAWRVQVISRWARTMKLTVKQRARLGRLGRYKAVYVTRLCKVQGKVNFWLEVAEKNNLRHLKKELTGLSGDEIAAAWGVWLDGAQKKSIRDAMDLAYETSEFELHNGGLLAAVCEDYIRRYKPSRKGKTAMN